VINAQNQVVTAQDKVDAEIKDIEQFLGEKKLVIL